MSIDICKTFRVAKKQNRSIFIASVTAGYPSSEATIELLLTLESNGADIIELGIPFTDALDGEADMKFANMKSIKQGTCTSTVLWIVREARIRGLKIPVFLMGYYNTILAYGEEEIVKESKGSGVNGYAIVDLPPEESNHFRSICFRNNISFIPLIAPTAPEKRIKLLVSLADSFIYVLAGPHMSEILPKTVSSIKKHTSAPLAVCFDICDFNQFHEAAAYVDGVATGPRIVKLVKKALEDNQKNLNDIVRKYAAKISKQIKDTKVINTNNLAIGDNSTLEKFSLKNLESFYRMDSRFGDFGGAYVPEILINCLSQLEECFIDAMNDPLFKSELESYSDYISRPSQLQFANRLTEEVGGARIWLKREDLNHTGSHKINNTLGQILLSKRLGKTRIIAETGAGQHGVATATVCAKFGMSCCIYMGKKDSQRQALNVFRMKMLGATVIIVEEGCQTLKSAVNATMRDWAANMSTTHFLVGSAIGPHPFPVIVREFQSIIGKETRHQMLKKAGKLPDAIVACVGGGSNAIGIFHEFINEKSVKIIGAEAGGEGIETKKNAATLNLGTPGVFHGTYTYLLQDTNGQITETTCISSGLNYPGVGPEHSNLKKTKRAEYRIVNDAQCLLGFKKMAQLEGIIPALESSHAIYAAMEVAKELGKEKDIVICLSGRGDKDMHNVAEALPKLGPQIDWDLRF